MSNVLSLRTKRLEKSNERMDLARAANLIERTRAQVSLYLEFPEMVALLAELERAEAPCAARKRVSDES